jgi:uncharacterized phage protein (TIGR01671 family)
MTNRTLKFRAWDTLAKKFTYPDKGYQGHFVLTLNGEFWNLQNGSGGDEYVVQQWTGLKDSKGNEIYEGDIISYLQHLFNASPDKYQVKTKEVKWKNMKGCWNVYESQAGEDNLEVIGNIFENSELLNNELEKN